MAAFQVLVEIGEGMEVCAATAGYAHHEQMLAVRDAVLLVVHDFMIAIEGKAVLDIAADAEDGHGLVGGREGLQLVGQRTGGIRPVKHADDAGGGVDGGNAEERADSVEEQHEHDEDAAGDEAQAGDSVNPDHNKDEQRTA